MVKRIIPIILFALASFSCRELGTTIFPDYISLQEKSSDLVTYLEKIDPKDKYQIKFQSIADYILLMMPSENTNNPRILLFDKHLNLLFADDGENLSSWEWGRPPEAVLNPDGQLVIYNLTYNANRNRFNSIKFPFPEGDMYSPTYPTATPDPAFYPYFRADRSYYPDFHSIKSLNTDKGFYYIASIQFWDQESSRNKSQLELSYYNSELNQFYRNNMNDFYSQLFSSLSEYESPHEQNFQLLDASLDTEATSDLEDIINVKGFLRGNSYSDYYIVNFQLHLQADNDYSVLYSSISNTEIFTVNDVNEEQVFLGGSSFLYYDYEGIFHRYSFTGTKMDDYAFFPSNNMKELIQPIFAFSAESDYFYFIDFYHKTLNKGVFWW